MDIDKMYRSKSAPRQREKGPVKFKVSVLPSIDNETIINIHDNSVSPLARKNQKGIANSKSFERLFTIK